MELREEQGCVPVFTMSNRLTGSAVRPSEIVMKFQIYQQFPSAFSIERAQLAR